MIAATEPHAARPMPSPLAIKLVWGGFLVAAAGELKVPVALCHACGPRLNRRGVAADAVTARAHKARALATYLTHVQAGFTQMAIADALQVARKNVCVPVQRIEDARDDAEFDQLVERVARAVAGEGGAL